MTRPYHGKSGSTLAERLNYYSKPALNDCREWTGERDRKGYGRIRAGQKRVFAHRASYEAFVGPIGRLFVCHSCDNPACINPDHLFLGTNQDNVNDMIAKGRQSSGASHRAAMLGKMRKGPDHHHSKLSYEKVFEMRWRNALGEKTALLAREYGVSFMTTKDAIAGRTWQFEIHD